MKSRLTQPSSGKQGFSLAELLLAMLVFAIAITTILALLARSIETVDEILLKDEAMQLSGAVESYFESQAFNDAYGILSDGDLVFAYTYRGDPDDVRSLDGTPEPVPSRIDDHVVLPSVRSVSSGGSSPELDADLQAISGRLFYVKMEVSENNPIPKGSMPADPDNYSSAVVVVFAEFYPVSNINNTNVNALGISPAYSYTFAVRR